MYGTTRHGLLDEVERWWAALTLLLLKSWLTPLLWIIKTQILGFIVDLNYLEFSEKSGKNEFRIMYSRLCVIYNFVLSLYFVEYEEIVHNIR